MALSDLVPRRETQEYTGSATEATTGTSLSATATNTSVAETKEFKNLTFYFANGTNQSVTYQVQAASDEAFTHPVDVGSSNAVAAGTNAYFNTTEHHPYMRVALTAATAPTSGNATTTLTGKGGA